MPAPAAGELTMDMKERSAERRKRMRVHRARGFREAEAWDLDFWLSLTPEERLSALVAIQRDVAKVEAARKKAEG
ncbi:MAG: hypothetical protein AB1726_07875 [Planctomycetota bacterium]